MRTQPIVMQIVPGESTPQDTADLLSALANLYRAHGGKGLKFTITPAEAPDHDPACDIYDRPPEGITKPCNCHLAALPVSPRPDLEERLARIIAPWFNLEGSWKRCTRNAREIIEAMAPDLPDLGGPATPSGTADCELHGEFSAADGCAECIQDAQTAPALASGPARPVWVLTDKNTAFIHPTKDSAELHRMRMYFPESWAVIEESGAAPVRYAEPGSLEDATTIWREVGGPVNQVAVQRDKVFGRWDSSLPWMLLGYLPFPEPAAPVSPRTPAPENPVADELLEAVRRWQAGPAPVNAALVLKVAERWAAKVESA